VTLITGYSPGGGFDLYTRVVAKPSWPAHPGNPRFIVQNMPGAGARARPGTSTTLRQKTQLFIGARAGSRIERCRNCGRFASTRTKFLPGLERRTRTFSVGLLGQSEGQKRWGCQAIRNHAGRLGPGSDEDMYAKDFAKAVWSQNPLVSGYPGGAEMFSQWKRGELDGRCCGLFQASRYRSRIGSRIRRSDSSM